MLTLKGGCGKSCLIDTLMQNTNSICLEYNKYPVIYEAIHLDSCEYTMNDFLDCIEDELKSLRDHDRRYHYILIYTNNTEEEIQKIIALLNNFEYWINCNDVIITCK